MLKSQITSIVFVSSVILMVPIRSAAQFLIASLLLRYFCHKLRALSYFLRKFRMLSFVFFHSLSVNCIDSVIFCLMSGLHVSINGFADICNSLSCVTSKLFANTCKSNMKTIIEMKKKQIKCDEKNAYAHDDLLVSTKFRCSI